MMQMDTRMHTHTDTHFMLFCNSCGLMQMDFRWILDDCAFDILQLLV